MPGSGGRLGVKDPPPAAITTTLASIAVPVSVWQGAQDRMVPFAHGKWLAANVPGASVHLDDDQGHLSLWGRIGEILDDLLERRG